MNRDKVSSYLSEVEAFILQNFNKPEWQMSGLGQEELMKLLRCKGEDILFEKYEVEIE